MPKLSASERKSRSKKVVSWPEKVGKWLKIQSLIKFIEVPATYACMFGLSTSVPGIPEACLDFGVKKGFSYVLGSGPENRTYWFLFVNLGRVFTGSEIPQLTESDIDRVVQEHWDDHITPDVRLSDLYKYKRNVVFSPMREFVYEKWHLNRSIVLGDAAHQVSSKFHCGIPRSKTDCSMNRWRPI